MKTRISLFMGFLFLAATAWGQPTDERRDRLEAAKVAFITKEVGMTSEEAKVFWPIQNAMEAELRAVDKDPLRDLREAKRDATSLSDADALKLLKELEAMAEKREAIRKKYQKKFLEVLPAHKVVAYMLAGREFQRRLREKLEERRPGGRPEAGGRPGGHPGGRPGGRPDGPGGPPPLF